MSLPKARPRPRVPGKPGDTRAGRWHSGRAGPSRSALRGQARAELSGERAERARSRGWTDGGKTDSRDTVTRECAEETAGGNHPYQSGRALTLSTGKMAATAVQAESLLTPRPE